MADMGMLSFQTPEEVALARKAAEDARNMQMSQMGLGQSARYGMLSAGSALGNAIGAATGYVDPNEARAQKTQQVMSSPDSDLNTSKGMLAKAAELRTIDPRLSMQLLLKGRELEKQEQAAVLAGRKQDFIETEALQFKRDQLLQQAELKKLELEQRAKDAQIRSEDARYSADQRRAAAAEAAQTRVMIAALVSETKKATTGAGKPLTPIQVAKQDKMKAESSAAIRAQDNDIVTLGADIDKVANDPNLSKATGMSDYIPSRPGGAASQIEGQLDSIVNKLKAQGLKVLREGGGIGAITEKEWDILANQVANIDRKKGDVYVKGELEKVKLRMAEMKRNAAQRHAEQFGEEYVPSRDTLPAAGGGMPTPNAIAAEIARRRKGGK